MGGVPEKAGWWWWCNYKAGYEIYNEIQRSKVTDVWDACMGNTDF